MNSLIFRSSGFAEATQHPEEFLYPSGATTVVSGTGAFLPISVIQALRNAPPAERDAFLDTLVTKIEPDIHARTKAALSSVTTDFADTMADLAK